MKIIFHKNFEKKYIKLSGSIKAKFKERLSVFAIDPYNIILSNHALHGKYVGYRSINITDDIRAVYKFHGKSTVFFSEIGSHSKLYS